MSTKTVNSGGGGGGATTFLALTDTPASFSGQELLYVRVNAGGTALEFAAESGLGDMLKANNLSDLVNKGTSRTNLGVAIGSNVQAYNSQLDALAAFVGTGYMVRTGANTYVARILTGTANEITLTNGGGGVGNPVVSIATNPIIPGNIRMLIPFGTTGNRPGSPVTYDFRGNSSIGVIEWYDGGSWRSLLDSGDIGSSVQAQDASLDSIAGLTYASGSFIALTGADTYTVRTYAETLADLSGVAGAAFSLNSQDLTAVGSIGVTGTRVTKLWATDIEITNAPSINGSPIAISNMADVDTTGAVVDQTFRWNGSDWVPTNMPVGATTGRDFYNDNTPVIAGSAENNFAVETLTTVPSSGAEVVEATVCSSNTLPIDAYLNGVLGKTAIPAGVWSFETYCSVSSVVGGRVSSIERCIYQAVVDGVNTVTTTGSGTSRTCTASGGTPFEAGDANADQTLAGYVQTPKGLYQITGYTSTTVVTIATPAGYGNESGVSLSTWKYLFQSSTGAITNLTTDYGLYLHTSVQTEFSINATDKLGTIAFATSNNSTTVNFVYEGTEHYTHFNAPLVVNHNDLPVLNGGTAGEYYHLTLAEHTIVTQAADTNNSGYLLTADWDTFNDKSPAAGSGSIVTTGALNSGSITSGFGSINNAAAITGTVLTATAASSLVLGTDSTNTGAMILYNSTNSNTTTIQAGTAGAALTFTLPVDDGDNLDFLQTNGSGVLSWAAGGGGASAEDCWYDLTGTRTGVATFTAAGDENDAEQYIHSLFSCYNSAGDTQRYGYIKSAAHAGGTVTYTVVTNADLAASDKDFKVTPSLKIETFQNYKNTVPDELVAFGGGKQGNYYYMRVDCYILPLDAAVVTPAVGTNSEVSFNLYADAVAMMSAAPDLTTNKASLENRMSNQETIAAGAFLSWRITGVGGDTSLAADFYSNAIVVPQDIIKAA